MGGARGGVERSRRSIFASWRRHIDLEYSILFNTLHGGPGSGETWRPHLNTCFADSAPENGGIQWLPQKPWQDKMNAQGGHFQFQLKPNIGGGQVRL